LVVEQHLRRLALGGGDEGAAIKLDAIARGHAAAGAGHFAVDFDFAAGDALFQRAAGAEPGGGQHLVQAPFDAGGGAAVALQRQDAAWGIALGFCSGAVSAAPVVSVESVGSCAAPASATKSAGRGAWVESAASMAPP